MCRESNIFAAIDIGSSKIVVLVGKINGDDKIQIIGVGQSASLGIKRGTILNIEEAFRSISSALKEAEAMSGYKIEKVYVNMSGQQLMTLNTILRLTFNHKHYIDNSDIGQLMQMTMQTKLDGNMSIYCIDLDCYKVDNESEVISPVGLLCENLEANYKIHVAPESYRRNIVECFNLGPVTVDKIILDPIASSELVLTKEEKEVGVALVDIGAGTTKISIFLRGILCYVSVLPFGGNIITSDIKEGCSILLRQAESLKIQFGQAIADFAPDDKMVSIPVNGWDIKQVSFKSLADIIQARMEDIISYFLHAIRKSGYVDKLDAGIVVTGGASLLPNLVHHIKFHTGYDVRVGYPDLTNFEYEGNLKDPRFSLIFGLLKIASEKDNVIPAFRLRRKKSKTKSDFWNDNQLNPEASILVGVDTLKEEKASLNSKKEEIKTTNIEMRYDKKDVDLKKEGKRESDDNIQFSVSYPEVTKLNQSYIIDVWAHFSRHINEVERRLKQTKINSEADLIVRRQGPFSLENNTRLLVKITMPMMKVDANEKEILWDGEISNTSFIITIPKKISLERVIGIISIHTLMGLQIAKIPVEIKISDKDHPETTSIKPMRKIRNAFVSYARKDLYEVLGRIQGMQKIMPELNLFLDVLKLRSGDYWEKELFNVIPSYDIFYLFWSAAAKKSIWVEKEWRCALNRKGIDFIDPVPLVSPKRVPPPPELSCKHFYDWTLAFRRQDL